MQRSITSKPDQASSRRGFTIVELLIVIVVIAILAAITIVAYSGITQRARVATVSSDLEGAAKQLALDQVILSTYPATVAAANSGAGLKASPGTTYQYTVNSAVSPQTFCITATNGTISYYVSSTNNIPTTGACAGQGVGGVAPVTNLVTNPSFETTSGTNVTGVASSTRATAETSNIGIVSGAKSLKITPTYSSSTDTFVDIVNPGFQANTSYTVLATYTLMSNIISAGSGPRLRFNIGGADMQSSPDMPKVTGTYQISWTFSVGVSNTINFLRIMPGGMLGDPPVYFDNMAIVANSTSQSYADGNSPNWIWNGTPNASTSTGPPL
jgi:prepilin-type N-terminal cleavage/methylation domain-containing protein